MEAGPVHTHNSHDELHACQTQALGVGGEGGGAGGGGGGGRRTTIPNKKSAIITHVLAYAPEEAGQTPNTIMIDVVNDMYSRNYCHSKRMPHDSERYPLHI